MVVTTFSVSSGRSPVVRTFLRICGNASKQWQISLTGRFLVCTTASSCSAATSPSPVVA